MLDLSIRRKLRNFTLQVEMKTDAKRLGIIGPSGSGKSQTMKVLAGIERPDSGHVKWNDRTLCDTDQKIFLTPQERRIAWLPQGGAAFPEMTVRQNLQVGVRDATGKERDALVDAMLEELGLSAMANAKPATLSGGENQRVALGRVLLNRPDAILLDEPFTGLDGERKSKLMKDLREMLQRHQLPAIFVSHDLEEVLRICDEVAVISEGVSSPVMTTEMFLRAPHTRAAAHIAGYHNFATLQREMASTRRLWLPEWGVELNPSAWQVPEKAVGCTFADTSARLLSAGADTAKNELRLVARVIEQIPLVQGMRLLLRPATLREDAEGHAFLELIVPRQEAKEKCGETVSFAVPENRLVWLYQ